jgi:hypothetical protein
MVGKLADNLESEMVDQLVETLERQLGALVVVELVKVQADSLVFELVV